MDFEVVNADVWFEQDQELVAIIMALELANLLDCDAWDNAHGIDVDQWLRAQAIAALKKRL